MAPKIVRLSLSLATCLLVSFCLLALTTPGVAAGQGTSTAKSKTAHQTASLTGCLQKGVEAGGFFLTTEDGKVWELSSGTVRFDKHVGHKVTVAGNEVQKSKTAEAKMESNEKKEADGKAYGDLHVTRLTMVSESCGG
jgi:hypothetical protein